MLYFSKIKLFLIYSVIIFLSFFSLLNFISLNTVSSLNKKVNLGLDLQGGSYLLLEVDTKPIIEQKLQNKLINLRKFLKEKKFKYENLKIKNESINFTIPKDQIVSFEKFFLSKDNPINIYFNNYKSYEMDFFLEKDVIIISYTK